MQNKITSILDFIFLGVILKALVAQTIGAWFIKGFNKAFKWLFVRSELELALWAHYMNKRLDKHHTHHTIKRL